MRRIPSPQNGGTAVGMKAIVETDDTQASKQSIAGSLTARWAEGWIERFRLDADSLSPEITACPLAGVRFRD